MVLSIVPWIFPKLWLWFDCVHNQHGALHGFQNSCANSSSAFLSFIWMCPYVISCWCHPHSYCFHGSVSSPPPLFSILLCKKFHRVASNFLTLNHILFVSTSFLPCSWFRVISTPSLSVLLCEKFHRVVSKNYLTWNPPTHRFSLRVDLSRVEETDESFIHVATLHLSFTVCWYFVPNKYASHKQCGKPLHSVRKHCHRCWLTTAPIFFCSVPSVLGTVFWHHISYQSAPGSHESHTKCLISFHFRNFFQPIIHSFFPHIFVLTIFFFLILNTSRPSFSFSNHHVPFCSTNHRPER